MQTGTAVRDYCRPTTPVKGPRQRIKYAWYRMLLEELTRRELHPQFAKGIVAAHFVSGIALASGVGFGPDQ